MKALPDPWAEYDDLAKMLPSPESAAPGVEEIVGRLQVAASQGELVGLAVVAVLRDERVATLYSVAGAGRYRAHFGASMLAKRLLEE